MITTALGRADTVTPGNAWPMFAHLTDYAELDLPHATEFADYVDLFGRPADVVTGAKDQQMPEDPPHHLTGRTRAGGTPRCCRRIHRHRSI
jgi:hypothetical protein